MESIKSVIYVWTALTTKVEPLVRQKVVVALNLKLYLFSNFSL